MSSFDAAVNKYLRFRNQENGTTEQKIAVLKEAVASPTIYHLSNDDVRQIQSAIITLQNLQGSEVL
jgi:hypothetical protein